MTEHLHLLADVAEEGVARPSADDHDGIDSDVGEVHRHGGAGSEGVGSDFVSGESQFGLADNHDGGAEADAHVVARQETELEGERAVQCVDWGLRSAARVGQDALDYCCPGHDGAHIGISGAVHRDGVVSLVILLEFKSDGYRHGHVETWVVVGNEGISVEETDIFESEELGPAVFGFGGNF